MKEKSDDYLLFESSKMSIEKEYHVNWLTKEVKPYFSIKEIGLWHTMRVTDCVMKWDGILPSKEGSISQMEN